MGSSTSQLVGNPVRELDATKEPAPDVGLRLAQLDGVIVRASHLTAAQSGSPEALRSCVERLLIESESARLTLLLDRRADELALCVHEMRATAALAGRACRRCAHSDRAVSHTLAQARQMLRAVARDFGDRP